MSDHSWKIITSDLFCEHNSLVRECTIHLSLIKFLKFQKCEPRTRASRWGYRFNCSLTSAIIRKAGSSCSTRVCDNIDIFWPTVRATKKKATRSYPIGELVATSEKAAGKPSSFEKADREWPEHDSSFFTFSRAQVATTCAALARLLSRRSSLVSSSATEEARSVVCTYIHTYIHTYIYTYIHAWLR